MTETEFQTAKGEIIEVLRQLWSDMRFDTANRNYMSTIETVAHLVSVLPCIRVPSAPPPMFVAPPPMTVSTPATKLERYVKIATDMYHTMLICEKAMIFIPNTQFPQEDGIRDTAALSHRLTTVNLEYRGLI